MLPFGLVLLIATSALAAPTLELNQLSINEVAPLKGNGRLISDALTDQAFEIYDGGDMTPNILTAIAIVNNLANSNDASSKALAVAQCIAILSQLSTGVSGDACAAANAIDAYIRNPGSARGELSNFLANLASNIDNISKLATNPNAVRFASGARGNCNGGGRTYSFEAAWDSILANASGSSVGLVNEQYCVTKRLFTGFDSRSNNVGAYLTAASLPPVNQAVQRALRPLANFLNAVSNGNPSSAAGAAKQALLSARNSL